MTADGKTKLKSPSRHALDRRGDLGRQQRPCHGRATTATARCAPPTSPPASPAPIVKDPVQDRVVWLEYLQTVVKERDGWKDLYRACQEVSA